MDLTTTCSLTSYSGAAFIADVTVSHDDQTFTTGVCTSGTCAQDQTGAVYALSWNRTNGCSYLKSDTWQVYNNGTLLGSATNSGASFSSIHNVRGSRAVVTSGSPPQQGKDCRRSMRGRHSRRRSIIRPRPIPAGICAMASRMYLISAKGRI